MNLLAKWRKMRRSRQAKIYYNRGYDYCAGAILRGDKTVKEMEDSASNPWDGTSPFDRGILDCLIRLNAINEGQEQCFVPVDREWNRPVEDPFANKARPKLALVQPPTEKKEA